MFLHGFIHDLVVVDAFSNRGIDERFLQAGMNFQLLNRGLSNVLLFPWRRLFVFGEERFHFLMIGLQHLEHGIGCSRHGSLLLKSYWRCSLPCEVDKLGWYVP